MDWLKQWARFSPKAIAFTDADSGTSYSYACLYYLSNRIAAELASRFSIGVGDRVAVLATNELEYIPLFFAIQRLGAIMVPINYRLTSREVAHVVGDSAPSLLVVQKQFSDACDDLTVDRWPFEELAAFVAREQAAFLADDGENKIRLGEENWVVPMHDDFEAPCKILYTSGTTGAPKGALITNKMLHWNSLNTGLRLNLAQSDVSISFLPFFHTGGWNVLVTPLVHRGARTVLLKKFDAQQVLELCERERATILFGVPTTLELMARSAAFTSVDLSSVRYAIVGGEPMPIELIKTWHAKGIPVRQGFGLTEFGPSVFSLNEEDALRKIGSIGFPNFYVEARVALDDGSEAGVDEIGELLLRGSVCTPGYWNNDAATRETIRDGWLHTGDLVRRDEEGYYYVAGRKKDMYKSGGENVYPVEVERFLITHPAIREVAVIGVPDEKWGEVGKAFIALESGASVSSEEVVAFCAKGLAKFKVPRVVEFLPALPKGDSGKILKRLLPVSK